MLDVGDLGIIEVCGAGALKHQLLRGRRLGEGSRHERGGLRFTEVAADGLAGQCRVAEHPDDVIAHLKRLTERKSVIAQRGVHRRRPSGEAGTEVQRALDGVLRALIAADAFRSLKTSITDCGTEHVQQLADIDLDAEFIPHRPSLRRLRTENPIRVDACEVTDEDADALTESPRLAGPAAGPVTRSEDLMSGRSASS